MTLISQFHLRHRSKVVLLLIVAIFLVAALNRNTSPSPNQVSYDPEPQQPEKHVLLYPADLTRVPPSKPRNTDLSEAVDEIAEVIEIAANAAAAKKQLKVTEEEEEEVSKVKSYVPTKTKDKANKVKKEVATQDRDNDLTTIPAVQGSPTTYSEELISSATEDASYDTGLVDQVPAKKANLKTKPGSAKVNEGEADLEAKPKKTKKKKKKPTKKKIDELAEDEVSGKTHSSDNTKKKKDPASKEKDPKVDSAADAAKKETESSAESDFDFHDVHIDTALSEAKLRSVVEKSKLIPDTSPKKNQGKFLKEIHNLKIFFRDVGRYFVDAKPLRDSYINGFAQSIQIDNDKLYISKEYLESILDIPSELVLKLKESHRRFVQEEIPKLYRLLDTFGGITRQDPEWKTYDNSRGYVMVASGKYLWMSYLFIKQLRATGAVLPVEIFIPTSKDYDIRFCNNILPKYNASCTLYSADLEQELEQSFEIGEKQNSIFALLNSKFESVAYLDPENIPVKNLDTIFDTKAFQENGLILWPDVWSRTTTPLFYSIASVPIYQKKVRYSSYDHADWKRKELDAMPGVDYYNFENTHYHSFEGTMSDPTTQAGAFVINKTQHLKTLLLALYYHVLGDKFYYPLLSQGANAHPELEALAAAAHVLEMPHFMVERSFDWFGYTSKRDSQIKAKAYGHFDPDGKDELAFLHLKSPKLFPELLTEDELTYTGGPAKGDHIRMFEHVNNRLGYDFDLRMFQFFTQALCANYYNSKTGKPVDGTSGVDKSEYMGSHIKYLGLNVIENKKLCTQLFIPHLQKLKETTEFPKTILGDSGSKGDKNDESEKKMIS